MNIDKDKRDKIEKLVKSFRELDACILPYQEQKKELRTDYVENGWLTKDEFSQVKRAYNALKRNIDLDELKEWVEVAKPSMP